MTLEPRQPRPPTYPRRVTPADVGRRILPLLRGLITPSICLFLLLLTPSANAAEPVGSGKTTGANSLGSNQMKGSNDFEATPCRGKVAAPPSNPPCAGAPVPNPPPPPPPCTGDVVSPPIDDPNPPCTGESIAPPVKDPPPCRGSIPAPNDPPPCAGIVEPPMPPTPPVPPPPATTLFRDVSLGAFCADPKSWLALQVRMRGSIRHMSDPDYPGGGFVLEDGTSIGTALARAPLVGGIRESDIGSATIEGRVVQLEGRNPLTRQTGTWYAISVDRIILDRR